MCQLICSGRLAHMDAFLRVIEVTLDLSCGGLITVSSDIAARARAPHLNTNEASKDEQRKALRPLPRGREERQLMGDGTHVPSHLWNVNQQAPMHMNATLTGRSCSWVIYYYRICKLCWILTTLIPSNAHPPQNEPLTVMQHPLKWHDKDRERKREKRGKKGDVTKQLSRTFLNKRNNKSPQ